MNLVDSSGWLEYLADDPGAGFFAEALGDSENLLVPTICMLEAARIVTRERGVDEAVEAVTLMMRGCIVDLDVSIMLSAAQLALEHHLPLADSAILATARIYGATLWTQDSDFKGIEGVRYTPKIKK